MQLDESIIEEFKDDYTQTEFTIGDVSFRINKLNALKGFKLFESIRKQVASSLNVEESGSPTKDFVKAMLSLEPVYIEKLRCEIFNHIDFIGNNAETYTKLKGAEDMAFQNLEPIHIYEVLGRALTVNFTESVLGLVSKFQSPKENTNP